MSDYTKNELALLNFISNVNKQFSYIGEENDQVSKIDLSMSMSPLGKKSLSLKDNTPLM